MKEENKKSKELKPEILGKEEYENTSIEKRKPDRPLATTLSNFSKIVLYNKIQEKRLRSFRKVIQEETGLMDDLTEHAKTRNRLEDIDVEIETEHLERSNRLREAKRESIVGTRKDQIAELELKIKEAELREKLKQIEHPTKKEEKLKKELEKKIQEKEAYQDYEIEKMVLKFKKEFRTQQAIDKVFNELAEKILQGRDLSELSEEERRKYENLEDFYSSMYDKE
jgi:hypothetical protein